MGTYDLELALHNVEQIIEMKKAKVSQNRLNLDIMLQISMLHRQSACGMLLARYDVQDFFEHLATSAFIYRYYLDNRGKDPAPDPYYLCRSNGEPFLDAVAANAMGLARDIGSKMPSEWTEQMEYEDDFFYFSMVSDCLDPGADQAVLKQSLASFKLALDGAESARFDAMKALIKKDEEAFDLALQAMVTERIDFVSDHRRSHGTETVFSITDANIFIEGIALIRVAKLHGLKTRDQFQLIPEVALQDCEGAVNDSFSLWDE